MNVKTVDNNRRRFLKVSGLALAGTGLLMACSNDDDFVPADPDPNPNPDPDPNVFDLGSGNLGILNYAYALEQLEAAFYAKVREGQYYAGTSGTERQLFRRCILPRSHSQRIL